MLAALDLIEKGSARASLRSVFGVALGLMIVALCAVTVFTYGTTTLAAAPGLAEHFELGALPFRFQLQEDLVVLPSGEQVYVLSRPGELPQVPPGLLAGNSGVSAKESEFPAPVDWSAVQVEKENGPPSAIFLVKYPNSTANATIEQQFRQVQWKELRFIESKGGRTAIDGGKLQWNGFGADFVHGREFFPELRFADHVRVNLTTGGQCWVAYGVWPEQEAGSKEVMAQFLGALRLVASD